MWPVPRVKRCDFKDGNGNREIEWMGHGFMTILLTHLSHVDLVVADAWRFWSMLWMRVDVVKVYSVGLWV
jgi:hypothetical protein